MAYVHKWTYNEHMYIDRMLVSVLARAKKSILLLGPRQTGKSTLIRRLRPELEINLADEETFVEFLRQPGLLKSAVGTHRTVFIDEIQRIPSLLNSVQAILDRNHRMKFYLTGSSARKLKRGKANLLPGRVLTYSLGPLSLAEIGETFDMRMALRKGLLPGVYAEDDVETWTKVLRSYALTYLKEEVQAEALTRNLEGFSRFFDVAVAGSGSFLDFTKFGSLASIERMSARRYFDVLADTLVVQPVDPFSKSRKTRLVQHPRYYVFDVGVLNGALHNFEASADRIGNLVEHLVMQLIIAGAKCRDEDIRLSVYRTEAGAEVDFILERGKDVFAIEVKASRTVAKHDLRGLKSFAEFFGKKHIPMVLYLGNMDLQIDGIDIRPIASGIRALGY
jgi:uncharacterized protein